MSSPADIVRMLVAAITIAAAAACSSKIPEGEVIYTSPGQYTLCADSLVDASGRTLARATSSMHIIVWHPDSTEAAHWHIGEISTRYPRATVGMKLPDALYNMDISSIAEARSMSPRAIRLSGALLDPQVAMQSLRSRVRGGRIMPSDDAPWPVCADRIEWIAAAYEVYLATGSESWMRELYEVARLTLADDTHTLYDGTTGLMHGSPCALHDAQRIYPAWARQIDLFDSQTLASNVNYATAFSIMATLSEKIDSTAVKRYSQIAERLRRNINLNLWNPAAGLYSSALYGAPFPVQSPVVDNAGQALAVLSGVAIPAMADKMLRKIASAPYGVPDTYPATDSTCTLRTSPDTQALYILAAAQYPSASPLTQAIAAQMAAQSINMGQAAPIDPFTGRALPPDTASTARADAAAGRLATFLRVLAGIRLTPDGIEFHPVVPLAFNQEKYFSTLRYRDASLSVAIHGTGNRIATFSIDGVPARKAFVPADIAGHHNIDIVMTGNATWPADPEKLPDRSCLPPTPAVTIDSASTLVSILDFDPALTYTRWRDGIRYTRAERPSWPLPFADRAISIAVSAEAETEGFTSKPLLWYNSPAVITLEAAHWAQGGSGLIADADFDARMVKLTDTYNTHFAAECNVTHPGDYLIDVRYANGNFPGYCAIRSLIVNGNRAGAVIMPSVTPGVWTVGAYSNGHIVRLDRGINTIGLDYIVPYCIVPGTQESTVLIKSIRLIKIR